MKIVVPKESRPGERRVALTADSAKRFIALGCAVAVEAGAGDGALFPDDDYRAVGAEVVGDISAAIADADVVLRVRRPGSDDAAAMKQGAVLVGMLEPTDDLAQVQGYADQGIIAFSLEFLPRITRAQSMDVLSSQSNLAGYKAVLDATDVFARAMPMMMTAAGTIAPAKVMVLGAGVAGLQAIATARRLGAVVSATDVRPAAKEQVESLGASFVMVEDEETAQAETAGGYAKEMSESYQRKQAELVRATLAKQDITICTALIPGRPAPRLITADMVKEMRPGSVIVDLAVESGGNCELSRAGEVVEAHGVKIVGHRNWPSRLATDASAFYARNVFNFLAPLIDADSGAIKIDWEDEIITATALTRDGAVIHPACKADA